MGNVSIKGYHKTRVDRAAKILKYKCFPISTGNDKWLGDGIYFWDDLENAKWWNNKLYSDGAILSADISCDESEYADLDDPKQMSTLLAFTDWLLDNSESGDTAYEFENRDQARAVFCTLFKQAYGFQLLKNSFPWIEHNRAGFKEIHYRPQYCATSMDIIDNIQSVGITIGGQLRGEGYGFV